MFYVILSYLFYPLVRLGMARRRRADVERILVIQTAKIGDQICATPVYRALAQRFPGARITVLVNPVTRELLVGNPHVHDAVSIRPAFYAGLRGKFRLAKFIRNSRYDVAVCMNPNVPFAVSLFWGLVPVRLSVMPNFTGVTFTLASKLFTHLAPHAGDRLVIQSYLDALRYLGIDHRDFTKDVVKVAGADEKAAELFTGITQPVIGIAVSSANKLKQLNAAMVAKLVDALVTRHDVRVALIGSFHDRRDADAVMARVGDSARVIDAVGKFTLGELPALLQRLSVVIGVDSGLTYLADACKTPIVQIAGPVNVFEQRPLGEACVIIKRELPCAPCSHVFKTVQSCRIQTRECIESVTAEEIYSAIMALLKKTSSFS